MAEGAWRVLTMVRHLLLAMVGGSMVDILRPAGHSAIRVRWNEEIK